MFLDAMKSLYTYHDRATVRVLDVAGRLSSSELTAVVLSGQTSVRDTFVHMFATQTCHFAWLAGHMSREESFARKFPASEYPDVSTLMKFWATVSAETNAFVKSLSTDASLERAFTRSVEGGAVRTRYLWEVMLHVANHGTQHRSEVALMLTIFGRSPGDLDIL